MGQKGSKDILAQGPSNCSVLLLKVLLAQTIPVALPKKILCGCNPQEQSLPQESLSPQ